MSRMAKMGFVPPTREEVERRAEQRYELPDSDLQVPKCYGLAARAKAWAAANGRTVPASISCPFCAATVGQADTGGLLLIIDHDAPCGLPCTGARPVPERPEGTHHSKRGCPRCSFKPCPVCKGTKGDWIEHPCRHMTIAQIRVWASDNGMSWYEVMATLDASLNSSKHPGYVRKACSRCGGVGRVDGLALYLEENNL